MALARAFAAACAALLVLAGPALANCAQLQTTLEIRECLAADYAQADAALNAAYQQARARMQALDSALPAGQQGAADELLAAQRAWIPFRDAACAAEGFLFRGGSMEPLIVLSCKTELTRQRSEQLLRLGTEY